MSAPPRGGAHTVNHTRSKSPLLGGYCIKERFTRTGLAAVVPDSKDGRIETLPVGFDEILFACRFPITREEEARGTVLKIQNDTVLVRIFSCNISLRRCQNLDVDATHLDRIASLGLIERHVVALDRIEVLLVRRRT